jgi:hypothetical protein
MKKIFSLISSVVFTVSVFAQSPEKMSYQAVIRNSSDQLVTDQSVGIQISILQGSAGGTAVYVETQNQSTNANGLVTLEIGTGATTDDFSSIDWNAGPYFIKTETDPTGGTNYTITGTSQLLSVPYALHAKTAETVTGGATPYSVGDFAQGGIVFWVDETGEHGLVCAKQDQYEGIRWHAGTPGDTQAKGDGPFSGIANTAIIIAVHAAIGDDGSTYAARICNELQITEGGKTYGDWYLPSKEELNLMYLNKETIDSTATANGGSPFARPSYWSSTERDGSYVWFHSFDEGVQDYLTKIYMLGVRAIRAF